MEQETKNQYTVNGYLFGDAEDVKLANQELSAIQYMDKKMERKTGVGTHGDGLSAQHPCTSDNKGTVSRVEPTVNVRAAQKGTFFVCDGRKPLQNIAAHGVPPFLICDHYIKKTS